MMTSGDVYVGGLAEGHPRIQCYSSLNIIYSMHVCMYKLVYRHGLRVSLSIPVTTETRMQQYMLMGLYKPECAHNDTNKLHAQGLEHFVHN